jgi:hypothetical protein
LMTVPPAAGFFDSGVYCGGSDSGEPWGQLGLTRPATSRK